MGYQQVALSDLQQMLQNRYESVPYWTLEEGRRALNEGLRIWAAATGFWRTALLVPTVPNDPYVAVPGTLVQGTRMLWNGLPLEPSSLFDFSATIPNWRGTTTATPGAPSRPVYWAKVSVNLFAIYPADAYATVRGTHELTVDGVMNTPVLVNPADFVDLGQEQLDVLLGYAQHVLAFKIGGATLTNSYTGWLAFLKAAAKLNQQFAASSYYRTLQGLDQQRRLRPPDIAASTSLVDAALAADAPEAS
jgi:hypothetical protein